MIQFNKTIFQSAKYLALIVAYFWIASPVFAEETIGNSYAEVSASATPDNASGKVYVSSTQVDNPAYETTDSEKIYSSAFGIRIWSYTISFWENFEVNAYLYAEDVTGYVWGGWWNGTERSGTTQKGQEVDITVTENRDWGDDDTSDNKSFVAKWVIPEVTGTTAETPLVFDEVTNPNIAPEDKSTTFQIKNYLDVKSFDLTNISPACFALKEGATTTIPEVDEQGGLIGELPVTIQFKPTGVHNLNIEGQFTLKSTLAKTDTYNNHSQTITLKASENYTPEFKHQYNTNTNSYKLGNSDTNGDGIVDVSIGSTAATTSGVLSPIKENYAAQAPLPDAEGKMGTIWTVQLQNVKIGNTLLTDDVTIKKLFDIDYKAEGSQLVCNTDDPILTFNADRTIITEPTTITAELVYSCIYYDKERKEVPSNEEDITYIEIQVTRTLDVIFAYDRTKYDFNEDHPDYKEKGENGADLPVFIGDNPSSEVIKLTRTNIDESTLKFQWWSDLDADQVIDQNELTDNHNVFEYSYNAGNVIVSVKSTVTCGDYSAVLVATAKKSSLAGEDKLDPDPQLLAVSAHIELATPDLQAYPGDAQVTLVWSEVPTATTYIIQDENENVLHTITKEGEGPVQTSYIVLNLENNKLYHFTVQAQNAEGCESKKSIDVTATPIVKQITALTAPHSGIMTGTDHAGYVHPKNSDIYYQGDNFPYVTKRQIDLSAAFDAEGKPIFDRLYVFGKTTSEDKIKNGDSWSYDKMEPAIAATPCYIYEPRGDKYVIYNFTQNHIETEEELENGFNNPQVYSINISNSTDNTFFQLKEVNGKNFYFTGYCPYAFTGSKDQNGVVEIFGKTDNTIDLYLDNLQMYAKPKLAGEENDVVLDLGAAQSAMQDGNKYYSIGSGAVFVFRSDAPSTNAFKPNIHIRNYNSLDATPGSKTSIYIEANNEVQLEKDNVSNSSSPIHILPTEGGGNTQATSLTIDDIWFNQQHTYGSLVLQEKNGETSSKISIDLGNETNTITINGGYLYSEKWLAAYIASTETFGSTSLVTYGLGETYQTNSKLIIQDGTFCGNEEIYAPQNTTIDGGSFITSIKEPETLTNKAGLKLKRFEVEANNYGTINNQQVTLTNFPVLMDDLFPDARYVDPNGYSRSLSTYYIGRNEYGQKSLIADNNNKVYLMLPYSDVELLVPWAVCSPTFSADVNGSTVPLGGPLNLNYSIDYLLYTEIDDIVREAIRQPGYKATGTAVVSSNGNDAKYSTINRTIDGEYKINKKVYLMKPVVAGDWTMFVAPFDICNVYVVEAYPDKQLKKDYGEDMGYNQYIIRPENTEAARYAQAQRWMDLYTYWYSYAVSGLGEDFNTIDSESNNTIVTSWVDYEKSRDKNGNEVSGENSPYTPTIEQLYHFTGTKVEEGANYPEGMKWWDANYYLYKSTDKIWSASKETVNGEEKVTFDTDWEIVTTQSAPRGNKVIMKRGEIYTMQFPATVGTDANDWNYWTGKYIIFEGVGDVQTDGTANTTSGVTVSGSNNIEIPSNIEYPNAHVMGNASFANVTVEHENLFYLNGQNFNRANGSVDEGGTPALPSRTLVPMEGFLLANVDETSQTTTPEGQTIETQKIAKSIRMETGEVIYDIKTTIIDNGPGLGSGLPTIMGDITLIVEPTAEGLTITPLKEQHVMLFDAEGKMIFSKYMSEEESVSLPTGVYVVRGEYEQVKAIKK